MFEQLIYATQTHNIFRAMIELKYTEADNKKKCTMLYTTEKIVDKDRPRYFLSLMHAPG
jgi:hypothetical protein